MSIVSAMSLRPAMTKTPRSETEVVVLTRQAQSLAASRKERVTTAHFLAVIALEASPTSELLRERRLFAEDLLLAARTTTDDHSDALKRAAASASEVAERMRAPQPRSIHLLIALLSERCFAAYRALDQCGVDISRLRVLAMNVGLGQLGRQPIVTRRELREEAPRSAVGAQRGAAVSLTPKSRLLKSDAARPSEAGRAFDKTFDFAELGGAKSEPEPRPMTPAAPSASEREANLRQQKRRGKNQASRFALSPKKFPTLLGLGRNLCALAEQGQLEPVFGRELEIDQTLDVLAKRQGNNPVLVGLPGVGKSSVMRGVALRIAHGHQVQALDDKILIEIPVAELLAGTGVRGALAQRVSALRKEVLLGEGRIVLCFDEIHQLFLADGIDEIAAELKLALGRGELPCIGTATEDEYRRAIESDPALARRFSRVEVDEPSREDAYLILDSLLPTLRAHHNLGFSEEALALSVAWSIRYLPGKALPDKALGLLDLAGARARRRGKAEVLVQDLAEVVSEQAEVPLSRLLETDRERMLALETHVAERIVGHEDSIARIARIIRRNAAGLNGQRPIGTFLLLGPTGVGKTETAKAVAAELFGSDSAMTRLDLSEYSEAHAVARLIGAPPGYVGHEAGGQLTEAVRRRPYQVLLLDEIEKAHPEVLETFLGLFDEGRLTDGRGRTIDFCNTVIFLTSNLGSSETKAGADRSVGFRRGTGDRNASLAQRIVAAARGALLPELYNRIDEVLVFMPLAREHLRTIARRLLDNLGLKLSATHGVELRFNDAVIESLLDHGGFEPELGARPLKRAIARQVEGPLAERLLAGEVRADTAVVLSVERGVIGFRVGAAASAAE